MVDNDSDVSHHSKSFAERSPQSEQSEQHNNKEKTEIMVEDLSPKSPPLKLDLDQSNNVKDVDQMFFGGMIE
jgi:hypothetical protein